MPTINAVEADHHVFVVPGVVDGDVVREQANKKWDKQGETTYVHEHKADEACQPHKHHYFGSF